jgi:hypothetical protein
MFKESQSEKKLSKGLNEDLSSNLCFSEFFNAIAIEKLSL